MRRLRISLFTLLLAVVAIGSAVTLWLQWAPWRHVARSTTPPVIGGLECIQLHANLYFAKALPQPRFSYIRGSTGAALVKDGQVALIGNVYEGDFTVFDVAQRKAVGPPMRNLGQANAQFFNDGQRIAIAGADALLIHDVTCGPEYWLMLIAVGALVYRGARGRKTSA